MSRTPQEQLVHFLSDMYSVEQQALAQLVSAPNIAGDEGLAEDFRRHHLETEQQAALVGERLETQGGSPSTIKNAVMKLGGKGFLLFARVMPETPGRLVAHAYSYEAMEWAGYEMLIRFAERAEDSQTVAIGRSIRDQEREMMRRLEDGFDAAERVSHRDTPPQEMEKHVCKHLREAHALEAQGVRLLSKSQNIAGNAELSRVYGEHLAEMRRHSELLDQRLKALGSDRSAVEDTALALGGSNWGLFFQAQSDTAAKLAAFAYAFEHLEIAGYELLRRTAARAGDAETEKLCEQIIDEKLSMAEALAGVFNSAVQATLEAVAA